MPIICQLCNREFAKQITNSHLRSHGTSTQEYRLKFGLHSLSSPEYRQELSAKMQGDANPNFGNKWSEDQRAQASQVLTGREPWNKGIKITDPEHQAAIQRAVGIRESRYQSGELSRHRTQHSDATRSLLSEKQVAYAQSHPEEMQERAYQALETKKSRGQDLAFFRGKKHSDETKKLIGELSEASNKKRTEQSHERIKTLALKDDLVVQKIEDRTVYLECNVCHHEFTFDRQIFTLSKNRSNLCFHCWPRVISHSQAEQELAEFIRSLCPDAISNYRQHYHDTELDVYVPSKSLGFEFNGLYWHSEETLLHNGLSRTRDHDKLVKYQSRGIRVIQIMEDEWILKNSIVRSRIQHILGHSPNRIGARKTSVVKIKPKQANDFLRDHHILGSGKASVHLGLQYNGTLVAVMTFNRNNISRKLVNVWELDRFAVHSHFSIAGAARKLFQAFVQEYDPKEIISYSDNRWSQGQVYQQLDFEQVHAGVPNYWYFRPNDLQRIHRFTLRKNAQDNSELTEVENRRQQGYMRIFDSGHAKYRWTKK